MGLHTGVLAPTDSFDLVMSMRAVRTLVHAMPIGSVRPNHEQAHREDMREVKWEVGGRGESWRGV